MKLQIPKGEGNFMIADQRLNEILQIMSQKEFVEVEDLAARMKVSSMTIRRDLQKLSDMGMVRRQYGGASLVTNAQLENDYSSKKVKNQTNKQKLAQIALKQIHKNDIIYLDAGTTIFELASILNSRQNLTVITNDILIATDLCKRDINTILLGGTIQKATLVTIGSSTLDSLQDFRVTSSFLGASAISTAFDVLSPTVDKAHLKKIAMQIAQKTYLMVDSSKFNNYALQKFANLSDFTGVITDRKFSQAERSKLDSLYINILDTV